MHIGSLRLPMYAFMVLLGTGLFGYLGRRQCERRGMTYGDFYELALYGGVGALVGAKLWSWIEDGINGGFSVLNAENLRASGLSFYGGVFLGFAVAAVGGRLRRIDLNTYARQFIWLVPMLHAVWKAGCFCAGCCYGIPYDGPAAVTFPKGSAAPAGIPLFPAQPVEMLALGGLSLALYQLKDRDFFSYPVSVYLMGYGVIRFFLEFYRFHSEGSVPVARILSIFCVVCTAGRIAAGRCKAARQGGKEH